MTSRSSEPKFAVELPTNGSPSGAWYEVERDLQSRLIRVASMRGATKEDEIVYHYSGERLLSDSADTYQLGEHTGRLKYERDERGYRTRTEGFTARGDLTGYSVRSYMGDCVDEVRYSADGKLATRFAYYYSDKDVLIHYCRYTGDACYDYFLDPATGVATSRKKFQDEKLQVTSVYTHDANGEIVHEDVYKPNGAPFGSLEYSQGLLIHKDFQLDDGTKEEIKIAYDEKRQAKEAKFSVNSKLVCKFVYDRLPDGTIKRTLALGPGGELWAEYPGREVNQVEKTGQASNRDDAILHRPGNWW